MRFADTPERVRAESEPIRAAGIDVGVRFSLIARPTRDEAIRAARALLDGPEVRARGHEREGAFVKSSDSVGIKSTYALGEREWLTPTLWTGAVRAFGATSIALVGSPEDIASALLEHRDAGVSQFIISGWPKLDEMLFFGREILPLVRRRERGSTKETQ